MQLLEFKPRRPVVHATCDDGYSGRVEYIIEFPDGKTLPEKPTKVPTYALIALLVKNYRLTAGISKDYVTPTHWDKMANCIGGNKTAEKENRRDPHEVRKEEMAAIRKAMRKDMDS